MSESVERDEEATARMNTHRNWIPDSKHRLHLATALAFFLSGAAALMYQVAWQRVLFSVVGVDIESVTVVVSVFMLGLGLGGLLGGWVADRWPQRLLAAFCVSEALIAVYGWHSIELILSSASLFDGLTRPATAALCFVLLLPPTVAMGATLPMLVAHAVRQGQGVGVSTGRLYFVNTLGAALGALSVGTVLLFWFDLRQTTGMAAGLNAASCLVLALFLRKSTP